MTRGVLDTSVFVAREAGRPLGTLPRDAAVSVVTVAELEIGVLLAADTATRSRRLATLTRARETASALPIDRPVASRYAALVAELRTKGRRVHVQDVWIAATALAHDAVVCTQDADFDQLDGVLGLIVERV